LQLVQRAEAAGYKALVMTVDAPVNGVRNREQRAGFALPAAIRAVNLQAFPAQFSQQAVPGESPLFGTSLLANVPMWEDVAWLCRATTLPVILKGILSPDDALQAIDVGAAGIIVSNHGGRVLDTVPATIEALPAVAAAINGQIPILLDGGIRRGTDVLKALALGANAVLVGRPYAHALAAAGALGVAHMLHVLRTEFEVAMALTGCATLQDITPHVIFRSR
jgi:4-hydroxymandelate oxidase